MVTQQSPANNSVFEGWETYPRALPTFNPFCCNAEQLRRHLDAKVPLLFSSDISLHVVNANASSKYKATIEHLQKETEAENHFRAALPSLRIISIVRQHSLSPLRISKDILLKILQRHTVGACFLDLLFAFQKQEDLSEKANSLWSPIRLSEHEYEICYQLKYIEVNNHRQGTKWSERQLGVYHRFSHNEAQNAVMILLHASPSTNAQQRIQDAFSQGQYRQASATSPLLLHAMIIGTYLDNWRWFLYDYGKVCMDTENRFLTTGLHHHSLTFHELQELRNIESRILAASTILKATATTIYALESAGKALAGHAQSRASSEDADLVLAGPPELQALKTLSLKCCSYLHNAEVVQHRVTKLIKLLSDGLSQQSQNTATDIANSTYTLTKKSVDDNATVRVITVITLIYLPTQFVATFFGMNLTSFSEKSITFSHDWWLFLAAALPLTFVTLGVLGAAIMVENDKKRKGKDYGRGKCGSS